MSGARIDTANVEATIDKLFGTGTIEDDTAQQSASADNQAADGEATDEQQEGAAQSGSDTPRGGTADGAGAAEQKPAARPQAARNGDLIGPNGEVLARGGAERRYYETAQRATRELNTVKGRLTAVEAELNGYKAAATLPTQLGLGPAEVTTAMQFMSHWKQNPVEAAKKMLAELTAAGYNIDELKGGVDVSAIKKMIEDNIAPFKQDREAQTREQQIAQEVQREIEDTFAEFPWAAQQQRELDAVLQQFPGAPLREVVLRVEAWAYRNGYDVNQPLTPQVLARQQNGGSQQAAPPNNARGPARTGAAPNSTPRRNVAADTSRSNRDIVREVMREHGLNLE
jgi:hypothetical protein